MEYLELKRWDNRNVIHSGEFESMKDLVEDAVRKGIRLEWANLKWANMIGANLEGVLIFGKSILSLDVHSGINRNETYKHKCYAAITKQGEIFICMGCKRLTLGQWQSNWKNNKKEFPTGSRKERQRRAVYNYLVAWAKIEVERLDAIYKRNPNGSFILEGAQ